MRTAAGRVLGLALVVLLLMSVVGLAASQTFINKTGKTVTGIRIEFSRSVTVTRHDSAFPDQSPSGRSDEFTFSGRDLRNLGRFSITWMPSSAKVTDYEWVKKAQPAPKTPTTTTQQEEEFKLPDPNTPPILYGDDYPGPDEPLYQPQPDEQIWLTDLDGHGDIYDNDSIVINYAPGFDKSQITKIEVYRNGVKLRFLPEKFDVLTNAQMKTFDGNPLEHSPASNHTDHAIFGYAYEFRFFGVGSNFINGFVVHIANPFRFTGPRSVNIGVGYHALESLSDASIVTQLRSFSDIGFDTVQFSVFYYSESRTANNIVPIYDQGSPLTASWSRTMTDDEIKRLLRLIDEAGLRAEMRLEIWLSAEYLAKHPGGDRASLAPADVKGWFENYTRVAEKLARIAEEGNADVFCLGVELISLEQYALYWSKLAQRIKTLFSGDITVNEYAFDAVKSVYAGHWKLDQRSIGRFLGQFWDSMDYIEIDSWPTGGDNGYETQDDQRCSVIQKRFTNLWKQVVDYYRTSYPGKKIAFGELGTYNFDGVAARGGSDDMYSSSALRLDDQEVTDMWAAMIMSAIRLGLDRITVWSMVLNPSGGLNFTGSHYLNIWPVVSTIRSFFGTVPAKTVRLNHLSVSESIIWSSIPGVFTYSTEPKVSFYCDGDQNLSHAQFWRRSGCEVSSVKTALTNDALVACVDLHQGDQIGHYRYIISYNFPDSGRMLIFLDPLNSAADVARDVNNVWTWIGTMSGDYFGGDAGSAYTVVPFNLISDYVTYDMLSVSQVDFHIDYIEGARRELFIFSSPEVQLECIDENVLNR